MVRFLSATAAAVLAIAAAGCAAKGGETPPCGKDDYAYVSLGRRKELRKWCATCGEKATCCIKDDKPSRCTKNPAECPEDAKSAEK